MKKEEWRKERFHCSFTSHENVFKGDRIQISKR